MIHSHYDPPQILWFLRNYWKHTRENLILEWRRNFRDDGFGKSQYQWLKSRYGMKGEWGAALNTPPYPGAKPGGPNTSNYEAPGIPREPPPGNIHTGSSSPAPELIRSSPRAGTGCRGSTISAANMAAATALNTSFSLAVPSRPHASYMGHANMSSTSAMITPHIHALGQHHVSPSPSSNNTRNIQSSRSNSRNSDSNDPRNTQINHEYTIPTSLSCDSFASTQASMPPLSATGALAACSSFDQESIFVDAMPFSSSTTTYFDADVPASGSFYPLSLPALPTSVPYSFSAPQFTGFQHFGSDDSSSSLSFLHANTLPSPSQYDLDDAYLASSPPSLDVNVPASAYVSGGFLNSGGSRNNDLGIIIGGHSGSHSSGVPCGQTQTQAKTEQDYSKRKGSPIGSQVGCRKRRQADPDTPASSTNAAISIPESSPENSHAVLPTSSSTQIATASVTASIDTSAIVTEQTWATEACDNASSCGVHWFIGKHGRCKLDARHRHDDSGGIYFSSTDDCISAVLSRPDSSSNAIGNDALAIGPSINLGPQSDKPPMLVPNASPFKTDHFFDLPPSDAALSSIPSSMPYQAKSIFDSAETVRAAAGTDRIHIASPSALVPEGNSIDGGNKSATEDTSPEPHDRENENKGGNTPSSHIDHDDPLQPMNSSLTTLKKIIGASVEKASIQTAAVGASYEALVSSEMKDCMLPIFDSQDDVNNAGLSEGTTFIKSAGVYGDVGCGDAYKSNDIISSMTTASATTDSFVDGSSNSGSENADPEWLLLFGQLTE